MTRQLTIRPLGPCHNRQNKVQEGFIPIVELPIYPVMPCPENTFANREFEPPDLLILYSDHYIVLPSILLQCLSYSSNPKISNPKRVCRMSSVQQRELLKNF
jgi:hypothetical protein